MNIGIGKVISPKNQLELVLVRIGKGSLQKKLRKFGHMSKLGLPYLPSTLVWTKKSTLFSTLPTYPKSLDILKIKFGPKRIFSQFFKDSSG